MPNLSLIAIALLIVIIGLLVALAFKLRSWMWDIHRDAVSLGNALKHYHQEANTKLITAITEAKMENINAICLAPLRLEFPVFLGGWSIDSFLGRQLVQHILEYRPKCVVELGSGTSTILIARTLMLLEESDVTHIVVDHEEKYLDLTRNIARLNGVANHIEFIYCPLVRYEAFDKLWYSDLTEWLETQKIDLLVVDGPPGYLQPHSRYPALPLLHPLLAEHCTIVLDDAIRQEEHEIAQQWVAEFPEFKLEIRTDGHGIATLMR